MVLVLTCPRNPTRPSRSCYKHRGLVIRLVEVWAWQREYSYHLTYFLWSFIITSMKSSMVAVGSQWVIIKTYKRKADRSHLAQVLRSSTSCNPVICCRASSHRDSSVAIEKLSSCLQPFWPLNRYCWIFVSRCSQLQKEKGKTTVAPDSAEYPQLQVQFRAKPFARLAWSHQGS